MSTPKLKVATEEDLPQDNRLTVFWYRRNKSWQINRERLYAASTHLGFRLYKDELYQVIEQFIHERDPRFYFDALKDYIKELHQDESQLESIYNAYETFIQKNGKFTLERLTQIAEHDIVRDGKHRCYKFYQDAYILITAKEITKHPYSQLPGLVFANKVQPRIFRSGTGGRYIEFMNLACDLSKNMEYISKIAGYYAHEYNDEGMGYFAVLTETVVDPEQGGGSGKNTFSKLFTLTTSFINTSGSQITLDESTFQIWNGERIFSISDLPKDFDFAFFKDISTSGIIHKRLYKDRKAVDISVSPKLMFNTNYSYTCTDGGVRRRLIPLEFTDFFTNQGGIEGYFNCWFPTDWDDKDWAGYDGFITRAVQTWFQSGCKMKAQRLSETGWAKQFELGHGPTINQIIETYWSLWVKQQMVSNTDFKKNLDDFYLDNGIPQGNYRPKIRNLNKALEEYGKHFDVDFKTDVLKREAHLVYKCRAFISKNAQIEEENPF